MCMVPTTVNQSTSVVCYLGNTVRLYSEVIRYLPQPPVMAAHPQTHRYSPAVAVVVNHIADQRLSF